MRSIQSALFFLFAAAGRVCAETTWNLTEGVSPISRDVYHLHMTIFWICVVIGVLVFGVMFYSLFHHRKSKGAKAANFHSHTWLEITWTIIPALILVAMAIPATIVLLRMNNEDASEITIKITGYQWKWHYEYLEDGIKFFSNLSTPFDQMKNLAPKSPNYLREVDNPLVLPVHKKIRFLVTSNDVNHAWWVPDLAVKRDAVGGVINEAWAKIDKPGVYRGQCAELCGINHAFMPIVIIALSESGYKEWVAQQKGEGSNAAADLTRAWSKDELMVKGEKVYNTICAACHQPNGQGMPPTFPALKGSKIATGPLPDHIEIVENGKTGTAMQAFKNQLSDVELAAVITYERNAFGNNTGSLVQPIQLKALRDGKNINDALKTVPLSLSAAKATATSHGLQETPLPAATTSSPIETRTTTVTTTTTTLTPAEALKAAMTRGEQVYLRNCAACHQPNGQGMLPTFPALNGHKTVLGPVNKHIDKVMNGEAGTAMVAFKDQLKDQEIADVITYERNAWDNHTGTLVTSSQITAARNAPQPNGAKP